MKNTPTQNHMGKRCLIVCLYVFVAILGLAVLPVLFSPVGDGSWTDKMLLAMISAVCFAFVTHKIRILSGCLLLFAAVCPLIAARNAAAAFLAALFCILGVLQIIFALRPRPAVSMATVHAMSGQQFEVFCADVLRNAGFRQVRQTGGSGDQGVDILAVKDGKRYAVQCKRYSSKLDNTPVQEVYAGRTYYNCDVAAVLTNNYFTEGARSLANATGVLLWDADWLMKNMPHKKPSRTLFLLQKKQAAITETVTPVLSMEITADSSSEVISNRLTSEDSKLRDVPKEFIAQELQDESIQMCATNRNQLLLQAIELVVGTGMASVSMLQRRLKLGYSHCVRLIDQMEEQGIVGPFAGSQPRQVRITKSEWEAMKNLSQPVTAVQTAGSSVEDELDALEKLNDLKEKGIITQEEFDAKKKQILGI